MAPFFIVKFQVENSNCISEVKNDTRERKCLLKPPMFLIQLTETGMVPPHPFAGTSHFLKLSLGR